MFFSNAMPPVDKGLDCSEWPEITVPNDAISLEEMLRRFTVGEPLDVEHSGNYVDDLSEDDEYTDPALAGVDLEKMAKADLVDKEEFIGRLKKSRETFEAQEKEKRDKEEAERKEREEEETYQRILKKKEAAKPKKKEPDEGSAS